MIGTSSYKNWKSSEFITYSISKDRGQKAGYNRRVFLPLALFSENAKGENEYIKDYYENVLRKLDPYEVYESLDGSVLLSYGTEGKLSHRHIVASWLELFLGVEVPELSADGKNIKLEGERREKVKAQLKVIINEKENLHGFDSIQAAYLYNRILRLKEASEKAPQFERLCTDSICKYKEKIKKIEGKQM